MGRTYTELPDMYVVSLKHVMDALGISWTVAGQRSQAAVELIADSYTG
ncbi:hypothetical protein [Streptomyces gardneri]